MRLPDDEDGWQRLLRPRDWHGPAPGAQGARVLTGTVDAEAFIKDAGGGFETPREPLGLPGVKAFVIDTAHAEEDHEIAAARAKVCSSIAASIPTSALSAPDAR